MFCAESVLGSFSCSLYVIFFFKLTGTVCSFEIFWVSRHPALLPAVNRVNGQLEFGALAEMVRFLFALCDLIFFHRGSDLDSQRNAFQWQCL